jgi:hypothetical protein
MQVFGISPEDVLSQGFPCRVRIHPQAWLRALDLRYAALFSGSFEAAESGGAGLQEGSHKRSQICGAK